MANNLNHCNHFDAAMRNHVELLAKMNGGLVPSAIVGRCAEKIGFGFGVIPKIKNVPDNLIEAPKDIPISFSPELRRCAPPQQPLELHFGGQRNVAVKRLNGFHRAPQKRLIPAKPIAPAAGARQQKIAKQPVKNIANDELKIANTVRMPVGVANQFRKFYKQNRALINRIRPTPFGYKEFNIGDKHFAIKPIGKNNRFRVLFYRLRAENPIKGKGGSKRVAHGGKNDENLALVPVDNNRNFKEEGKKSNWDLKQLGLKTVFYSYVVNDKLIIAPNAGAALKHSMAAISLSKFQQAANDLATMHRNGIYLRDIKLENMAFDGKQVNFIDVDNRVNRRQGHIYQTSKCYTPALITQGLIKGAYFGRDERTQSTYFKTADEYAFLLSIISATSNNAALKHAIYNVVGVVDTLGGSYPGVITPSNKLLFNSWIVEHIKSPFRQKISALLENPAQVARQRLLYSNNENIVNMIKFY